MCRPTHFAVDYAINPWMDPAVAVDRERAEQQWDGLRQVYRSLGHEVRELPAAQGLPDMVFAANGALVIGDRALGARFAYPQRAAEAAAHRDFLLAHGIRRVARPGAVNEGEGDFAVAGGLILAGTGFRTRPAAHRQAQEFFGRPVVSLRLVDPRFYHLDVALGVLDATTVAYFPGAFSAGSRDVLARLFPGAVLATETDALAFGLNLVSDGRHVVLPTEAEELAARLADRGYRPIGVETDELIKAGGSVKCCTQEWHP